MGILDVIRKSGVKLTETKAAEIEAAVTGKAELLMERLGLSSEAARLRAESEAIEAFDKASGAAPTKNVRMNPEATQGMPALPPGVSPEQATQAVGQVQPLLNQPQQIQSVVNIPGLGNQSLPIPAVKPAQGTSYFRKAAPLAGGLAIGAGLDMNSPQSTAAGVDSPVSPATDTAPAVAGSTETTPTTMAARPAPKMDLKPTITIPTDPGSIDEFRKQLGAVTEKMDDTKFKGQAVKLQQDLLKARMMKEAEETQAVDAATAQDRQNKWGEVAETIGQALVQIGAGIYGYKNGLDLSGAKFNRANWEASYKQNQDKLDRAMKRATVKYGLSEQDFLRASEANMLSEKQARKEVDQKNELTQNLMTNDYWDKKKQRAKAIEDRAKQQFDINEQQDKRAYSEWSNEQKQDFDLKLEALKSDWRLAREEAKADSRDKNKYEKDTDKQIARFDKGVAILKTLNDLPKAAQANAKATVMAILMENGADANTAEQIVKDGSVGGFTNFFSGRRGKAAQTMQGFAPVKTSGQTTPPPATMKTMTSEQWNQAKDKFGEAEARRRAEAAGYKVP